MVDVVSLEDKQTWNNRIRSMLFYDFYHLSEYHELNTTGTPLLFYYKDSQVSIAFPFILRKISGTEYNDISSVYGYPGPVANRLDLPLDSIRNFQKELVSFFDFQRIVSVFSRLHPLFPEQSSVLKNMGSIEDLNLTVGIDLSLPLEEQRRQYSASLRNGINALRRKEVIVKRAQTPDEINSFIEIYRENMSRVNAAPGYYFSSEYFYKFLDSIDSAIFLAYHEREVIAGSLFAFCDTIMQFHLSATKNDFLKWSPVKLVIDEARLYGIEQNIRFLHLGGGVNGKNDSVFAFKSRFSRSRFQFKIWKYIHNKEMYQQLIRDSHEINNDETSFFPLYRA